MQVLLSSFGVILSWAAGTLIQFLNVLVGENEYIEGSLVVPTLIQ